MFLYYVTDSNTAFAIMRNGFIYLKDHNSDCYSGIELSKKEIEPKKGEMVLTVWVKEDVIFNDTDDTVKVGLGVLMNPKKTNICEIKWYRPLTEGKILNAMNDGYRKEQNLKV